MSPGRTQSPMPSGQAGSPMELARLRGPGSPRQVPGREGQPVQPGVYR